MAMSPSFDDDQKPVDADKNQGDQPEEEVEEDDKPIKVCAPKHWSPSAPYTTSVQTDSRDSWCLSRSRMVAPYFAKNQRPSLWGA